MSIVIAIGALGGSGTRAVAKILIDAGVYMGDDLNEPFDNLVFTRLFKNPEWYRTMSHLELSKRLDVFKEDMEHNKMTLRSLLNVVNASNKSSTFNFDLYIRAVSKIFGKKKNRAIWGWKEPNTQIYFEEIAEYFPNLKYIHVLRNGLDMAFSSNLQQLNNWGFKYGIVNNGIETQEELAVKQLDYWIASTKDVIKKSKYLGNNFLLVNHTEFWQNPKTQINKILSFASLNISNKKLSDLYKIPEMPDSHDRYKKFDLSIFNNDQLSFVREMGFIV